MLSRVLGEDVTKLAVREKQLLLSRLLARLAHEIRNPLSSLDIHVQLLAEDLEKAPATVRNQTARRLEVIRGELHRLNNVVTHFVRLAAPSSLDPQRVEIHRTAGNVCELLQPEAATRGTSLINAVPDDFPVLRADPVRLTQALVNLVINALQAIGSGGEVIVSAQRSPDLQEVAISIADNGPGVPEDKRSAIFEPFFTTKPEGTGLGLWIVQQIAFAHGGRVTVGSAPGGGALFHLWLPLSVPVDAHGSIEDQHSGRG